MKIAYSHLVRYIQENPTIEQVSKSLFQLGHEHEIDDGIFDMFRSWIHSFADWLAEITEKKLTISGIMEQTK